MLIKNINCSYKKTQDRYIKVKFKKAKQSIDQSLISTPKRNEMTSSEWNILSFTERKKNSLKYHVDVKKRWRFFRQKREKGGK